MTKWDTAYDGVVNEIPISSNSVFRSSKFISFLSLIDKFCRYKLFINGVLIKMDIVDDDKKKALIIVSRSRWLWRQQQAHTIQISQFFIVVNLSYSNWLATVIAMKKNIVINEKNEEHNLNTYLEQNHDGKRQR